MKVTHTRTLHPSRSSSLPLSHILPAFPFSCYTYSLFPTPLPNSQSRYFLWSSFSHHTWPPPPPSPAPPTQTHSSLATLWTAEMPSSLCPERSTGNFLHSAGPSSPPWPCCMSFTTRPAIALCTPATTAACMWRHGTTAGSVM